MGRSNSDSAWKDILDFCFKDFIDYCLPSISQQIDWQKETNSLDKELQTISRNNIIGNRIVDKLIKVFLITGLEQWILIHVEVQGKPDKFFAQRMFTYAYRIFDKYQHKILSCAILTDEDKNWRPDYYELETFGSKLSLKFLVIKILDYRGKEQELDKASNIFASVILTQLAALEIKNQPDAERLNMKHNLTKRLYKKGFSKDETRKLYFFLDWLVCLPESLEIKYQESLFELEEANKMAYVSSVERMALKKGIEQGRHEGRLQGRQEGEVTFLIRLLSHKFGTLPQNFQVRIKQADAETLLAWGERVLNAKTIDEVFWDLN